ncbi:hypothetical protein BDA99DRAFT_507994 [Phascolomyces articulosus]|uniref:DASH complex subunit SPC19 n=1 Tax=Phascolomyces articulosus TaxID=60185 RepID=A0AAD5K2D0_9FUNG|nr:hypothetical protein BDA99DRAFT_507994 [Phascolomyces articulosus]
MEQTEWRKPYTLLENLQGASSCLEGTVQNLSASINTLKGVTQDYDRLRTVTEFQMQSEIISENDIRYAENEVIGKRLPEIESLLTRAQTGLDALEKEAKAMESKVDEQTEQLKSLEDEAITTQPTRQVKKPRLFKNSSSQQQQPISQSQSSLRSQTLQKKKKKLEHELISLQTRVNQEKLKIEQIQAEKAQEVKKKEKEAVTSSDNNKEDHAPSQINDQTMTTEDIHTLKQIKTLCKLLLPSEDSMMVAKLLEQHVKTDNNNNNNNNMNEVAI